MPPLSRSDFRVAIRIREHLETNEIDAAELLQLAFDLAPVVYAQDVSLSLLAPDAAGARQVQLWTREIEPAVLNSITSRTSRSNPMVAAIRRGDVDAISTEVLHPRVRAWFLQSPDYRLLRDDGGFVDTITSPLRSRQGVLLGRIGFFRARGMPRFNCERTRLVGALRDIFSVAAGRIIQERAEGGSQEATLLTSTGEPIWMSDGFPFLWNTVSPCRLRVGIPALLNLLDGGWFAERVAMRVLSLSEEVETHPPHERFRIPCRGGRAELDTELTSLPGWQFWHRDRVLRIGLSRDNGPRRPRTHS